MLNMVTKKLFHKKIAILLLYLRIIKYLEGFHSSILLVLFLLNDIAYIVQCN